MQSRVVSTESVPGREQFALWREAFQAPFGVRPEPDGPPPDRFGGRLETGLFGPVVWLDVRCDPHTAIRHGPEIARRVWDVFVMHRERGPACRFEQGGREVVAGAGDLLIADAEVPYRRLGPAGHDFACWLLPRSMLEPRLPVRQRGAPLRLPTDTGAGALLGAYLDGLARAAEKVDGTTATALADHLCDLVAIGAGTVAASLGGGREALRAALLERARRHVDAHLARPDLSAETVAAAIGTSTRQLQRLFEGTGESFARYVLRRRLEAARAVLADPLASARPVAEIAFAWGFGSLPSFYRTFRQAYGFAPGDLRAAAASPAREIGGK